MVVEVMKASTCALVVALIACGEEPRPDVPNRGPTGSSTVEQEVPDTLVMPPGSEIPDLVLCGDLAIPQIGPGAREEDTSPEWMQYIAPPGWVPTGRLLSADRIDVDCDGVGDFIGVVGPSPQNPPSIVVAVNRGDSVVIATIDASGFLGSPQVAVAADLTGNGRRDLLFVGGDEMIYFFGLLAWNGDTLEEIPIPEEYRDVGNREVWDDDCRPRINPGVSDGRLVMIRELIDLASENAHGSTCDMPRDTLALVDGSLRRVGG